MRVLTLNPGSSSLKAALISDGVTVATDVWKAADVVADERAVSDAVGRWGRPDAVAIRFVHGGSRVNPVLLDDDVVRQLDRLTPLAPLHQPLSLDAARLVQKLLPEVPVVACFDTAFHAGLPEPAAHYALPRAWTRQNRLRRYGFHGLSCEYALRRTAEILGAEPDSPQLLCCHLGAGVSITAIRNGASVDTSMGFTPIEGAVMATRSGSVDPGLLLHVLNNGEISVDDMTDTLYHRSGLAGMTGTSGDIREILAARGHGDHDAELAIAVYLHRLRREIGAVAMSLDRLDAVVFTGGVAEHHPALVGDVVESLRLLGTHAGVERLTDRGDRLISPMGADPAVLILTAREDLELARHTEQALVGALSSG